MKKLLIALAVLIGPCAAPELESRFTPLPESAVVAHPCLSYCAPGLVCVDGECTRLVR